jgi:hypothetical protein
MNIPGVKRCHGWEELPFLIKEQLEEGKHDEESLVDYISALLENSIRVDYLSLWTSAKTLGEMTDNEGLIKLSLALAKKIGINK